MKRYIKYAFTVVSTVIFILSSGEARSQEKKEIRRTIIITDKDTIINGKKVSEASDSERKMLLNELDESRKNRKGAGKRKGLRDEKEIYIRRIDREPLRWREENGPGRLRDSNVHVFQYDGDSLITKMDYDSLMKRFHFKFNDLDSNMRKRIYSMDINKEMLPRIMDGSHPRLFRDDLEIFTRIPSRRENSQSFNYSHTDKDGISSRMSIRISETDDEVTKKINSSNAKTDLSVSDLTLSPSFSSGKLNLSFSLAEKGTTDIRIYDSSLKEIFSDKPTINNIYFKQIDLPKNGIYYIRISQGNNAFFRKIVKE